MDEIKRKDQRQLMKKTEKKHQNRDVCDACGGVGQFLCCDACPSAFHFTCVEPPMDSIDVANLKEKWFCNHCEHKQHKKARSHPKELFSELLEDLAQKNPKSFRLPMEITHFYKGVTQDKYGRYVDTTQYKRTKNAQLEQADYRLLKNKQGLILCYYCRKTSLKKQIIACDYCNLYWHLDCLNPPLAASPPLTKKWRCPHHIENLIKPRRHLRNPADVTIITHPTTPACAYQNYLDNLLEEDGEVEGQDVGEEEEEEEEDEGEGTEMTSSRREAEDVIVSQEGIAYRLPAKPIQFSNPISYEVETWLHNLACFKAGMPNDGLALKKRKTREMDRETYQRYQLIDKLLKEKSDQELQDLYK
ncbi:hypothetical protein EDC96DRAFT_568801 [Choanephora cucurbitarum]|nr:hypothetical protein EDC96DRAFT_568801 [Choanephora cucurbitarum]